MERATTARSGAPQSGGSTEGGVAPESVTDRLASLRGAFEEHPDTARDATWNWFRELGERRDTGGLDELFAEGSAPSGLDGPTDGILVVPTIRPYLDPAVRTLAAVWMPWKGKRFAASESRGVNRFLPSFNLPARLLWPRYRPRADGDERTAFDFETRVEPSADDPQTEVLVIDYAPVDANPDFIIRKIRDELVEIVPGANLGKILYRREGGDYESWGFFALRPSA
jgi:hypothetical protein